MKTLVAAASAAFLVAAFSPNEALARAGGFAAGGAHAGFAGGIHAFHAQPIVRVKPVPVVNHGAFVHFGFGPHFGFHRFVGNGLSAAGIGVYYGGYDYSGGYEAPDAATYPQPIYVPEDVTGAVPPGNPAVLSHGNCRSDVHTVPSEAGGERKVTVTRCY